VSIEWFRDLVLCIFGLSTTVVVLLIGVLAFICYRRITPIIDSLKTTTRTVENLTSAVEEQVAEPLAKVAAFVQGVRQAVSLVGGLRKNKED
jgi:butyrate kinase